MFGRSLVRVALAALLTVTLIGGAAALGWFAYTSGYAQGAMRGAGAVPSLAPEFAVMPLAFPHLGLGVLTCIAPLLFLFLLMTLFRWMLWGGMGWHAAQDRGPCGPWSPGNRRSHMREMAEEWHRQAHAAEAHPPAADTPPAGE